MTTLNQCVCGETELEVFECQHKYCHNSLCDDCGVTCKDCGVKFCVEHFDALNDHDCGLE